MKTAYAKRVRRSRRLEEDAVDEEPRVLHVAGDAVEDRVRAVAVEEAEAQVLEPGIEPRTEVGDDPAWVRRAVTMV